MFGTHCKPLSCSPVVAPHVVLIADVVTEGDARLLDHITVDAATHINIYVSQPTDRFLCPPEETIDNQSGAQSASIDPFHYDFHRPFS